MKKRGGSQVPVGCTQEGEGGHSVAYKVQHRGGGSRMWGKCVCN